MNRQRLRIHSLWLRTKIGRRFSFRTIREFGFCFSIGIERDWRIVMQHFNECMWSVLHLQSTFDFISDFSRLLHRRLYVDSQLVTYYLFLLFSVCAIIDVRKSRQICQFTCSKWLANSDGNNFCNCTGSVNSHRIPHTSVYVFSLILLSLVSFWSTIHEFIVLLRLKWAHNCLNSLI